LDAKAASGDGKRLRLSARRRLRRWAHAACRPDGDYAIGRVLRSAPPVELVFGWRPTSFEPHQTTEVRVRFESVGDETRVTIEHKGWDSNP